MNKNVFSIILSFFAVIVCAFAFGSEDISASAALPFSDPDGSGSISISDAILINNYLAGRHEPTDIAAYDVDSNGVVSIMDAKCIELYLGGFWNGVN